jgi:hypothetical protein
MLSEGDRAAIAKLTEKDLIELLAATSTSMSVETFQAEAKKWLAEAKDPRWKKPYTELTYSRSSRKRRCSLDGHEINYW